MWCDALCRCRKGFSFLSVYRQIIVTENTIKRCQRSICPVAHCSRAYKSQRSTMTIIWVSKWQRQDILRTVEVSKQKTKNHGRKIVYIKIDAKMNARQTSYAVLYRNCCMWFLSSKRVAITCMLYDLSADAYYAQECERGKNSVCKHFVVARKVRQNAYCMQTRHYSIAFSVLKWPICNFIEYMATVIHHSETVWERACICAREQRCTVQFDVWPVHFSSIDGNA